MSEKTEAQKRAQKAYMEKFAVARVRMDRSKYEVVQAYAAAHGESVNGFINRAIDETMRRDSSISESESWYKRAGSMSPFLPFIWPFRRFCAIYNIFRIVHFFANIPSNFPLFYDNCQNDKPTQ